MQTIKETKTRIPRRAAPATADIHPQAMLRIQQILGTPQTPALLNIGRSHFYELIQRGKFPKPTKLGHISLWRAGDVLEAIHRLGSHE